jgi:hypothetical protein
MFPMHARPTPFALVDNMAAYRTIRRQYIDQTHCYCWSERCAISALPWHNKLIINACSGPIGPGRTTFRHPRIRIRPIWARTTASAESATFVSSAARIAVANLRRCRRSSADRVDDCTKSRALRSINLRVGWRVVPKVARMAISAAASGRARATSVSHQSVRHRDRFRPTVQTRHRVT